MSRKLIYAIKRGWGRNSALNTCQERKEPENLLKASEEGLVHQKSTFITIKTMW